MVNCIHYVIIGVLNASLPSCFQWPHWACACFGYVEASLLIFCGRGEHDRVVMEGGENIMKYYSSAHLCYDLVLGNCSICSWHILKYKITTLKKTNREGNGSLLIAILSTQKWNLISTFAYVPTRKCQGCPLHHYLKIQFLSKVHIIQIPIATTCVQG